LGLDHSFVGGKLLIFETMVFDKDREEIDVERYSTEKEALVGHLKMVKKWEENKNVYDKRANTYITLSMVQSSNYKD
tara:strand:- start:17773 stop:18003 length:231 start_codon:yes stop_codon:yes gene_type:complete